MPSLSLSTTQTVEVELKPHLKRKLLTEMTAHAKLQAEINELEVRKKAHAKKVEEILYETGESTLELEGHKATLVAGIRNTLNKKKLSSEALAEVNACTEKVPNKPYVRITGPSDNKGVNASDD